MENDIILKTMQSIMDKYSVNENIALKYAKMTIDALESHGGTRTDFSSIIKVVDVVVKRWLENNGYI